MGHVSEASVAQPYQKSPGTYTLFTEYMDTLEPKFLYLPQKRLAVTSSAMVVLTAFLDSPNLPKEGLSGLKGKFSWRDA